MKKLLSIILSITMLITMSSAVFADETTEATAIDTITADITDNKNEGQGGTSSARVYTFEELTGFSRDDIDHIVIRSGVDGVGYSTSYDKLISGIYNTINTGTFFNYSKNGNSGGWQYEILFFDTNNLNYSYTLGRGLVNEKGFFMLSDEEELKKVVENAYNLIANDCSEWSADYIVQAKDFEFLEDITDISYKEPITREDFCELVYNLIKSVLNKGYEINTSFKFDDTDNESVIILNRLGIINGKTETQFAPDDLLTREEAATIIIRMINTLMPMAATEMWFEFDDINEISDWASDSVQTICNLGFMNGVGNNKFAPKDTYTTEQAIATLVRVYEGAEAAGIIDSNASIGIIGGADGPTQIIVGENTTVIGGADAPAQIMVTDTIEVDDFYIDEAIKLITESGKLAADKAFIGLYTTNDDMTDKISALSAVDFSKPIDIFYLSADREQIVANITAMLEADGGNIEDFGDAGFEYIWRKLNFSTLSGLINSSYGSENLAALTILTNNRGYIMPKDFKNNFALFLQYDGEYSAFVSFSEYGEDVISANMSFVKNGDKDNVFRRLYEITQGLGEDSIDVAKVK